MAKRKTGYRGHKIPGGFVTLPLPMLNHRAYKELPYSAKSMFPYFLAKVKIPRTHPEYYFADFSFTYSEAMKYGCARKTFYHAIESLMEHGFIDPVRKGCKSAAREVSIFRFSRRWEKYGTAIFEKVSWAEFGQNQIRNKVQKLHCTVAEIEPVTELKEKKQCRK